jgi:hypothetical protein
MEEEEVKLHSFSSMSLDKCTYSVSHRGHFAPGERIPGACWTAEAGRALELIWTLWQTEKFLHPP